jgi:hypothetical protein
MPFCPACGAEYASTVRICPDCETLLTDQQPNSDAAAPTDEDTRDVFLCHDIQLAERVAELLRDGGLSPLVREHRSSAFPVGVDSECRVAVTASEASQAQAILRQAVADSVLGARDGRAL